MSEELPRRHETTPRVTYNLEVTLRLCSRHLTMVLTLEGCLQEYDDRTDTSEYGHGPLTDRSWISPHQPFPATTVTSSGTQQQKPHGVGGNGNIDENIDDIVNQILERRSARLSGNPVLDLVGAGQEVSEVRVKSLPHLQKSILRSLDLECSAVPLGDPVVSAKERGYVSPFSPAETPRDDLSPPYLVDERKHLWQHLNDLENAVKALDAPSMEYSELPYDDTYADDARDVLPAPGGVSRGLPMPLLEEGSVEAVIQFRGTGLAAMDTSLLHGRSSDPYLVFVQYGKEIARTEVIDHDLNPVWKPLKLTFVDMWTPVSVQCWDKDTLTQDDFMGQNEVPVQDLLTMHREIHLMCKGKSSGKITVDSVSMMPTTTPITSRTLAQTASPALTATPPVGGRPPTSPMTPVIDGVAAPWRLKVSLKSAQHLPKMDTFGSCDAYVVVTVGDDKTFKSATIKASYSPMWNENFEFELDGADMSETLVFSVFDWDRVCQSLSSSAAAAASEITMICISSFLAPYWHCTGPPLFRIRMTTSLAR